ncbi:MAG: glutaredoxin [Methylococcales bacterium]|jgi:glutaredoxin|nr:glutaredoxin [Methylococcales bacterium]MBT7409829.1 glutaredoxin [Methylococcales bacterium]
MLLKLLRGGLGRLIILIDFITRPPKTKRSDDAQNLVNEATKSLSLYQFYACPFCTRVRRTLHRLNINISLKDAKNSEKDRSTLLNDGGQIKVPCLRIEDKGQVTWLYESKDIIQYLDNRFALGAVVK